MNAERWQRVQRLFEEALAQPAEARTAFIVSACDGEAELRDELLSLLAAHEGGRKTEGLPATWLGTLAPPRSGRVGSGDGPGLADQLNAALTGRYAIQRELGSGGMATVFLAEDLRHRRSVAIKVLHRELAAALGRERFLQEIEIAAGLSHPHILPLYDSGAAGDLLYFVMPYVAGESLRQRLVREKQLPVADAQRIARDVADALDYAHRRGVVHRDLKPENILLQEQHAVLADFGIARAIVAAGGEKLTATGVVIGTPDYMSPEQAAASRDLDGRSDVYGLGCVVYEMLAGQPPFTGPTVESIAHQHLNVPPRPVTDLRPTVPAKLTSAITRALAKAAADRFRTPSEFATALAAGAESEPVMPVSTTPVPAAPPTAAPVSATPVTATSATATPATATPGTATPRRRPIVAAVSAATILLVAIAAWRFGPSLFSGPAPDPANKAWILVAEFDGPAADSAVVAATRDLVMAALDQSEAVATVPPDQIQLALESAGKPSTTRVDGELARDLAYRSSVRTVLAGRVGRLGRGYSIVLRVVDADSARVVLSVSDAAADEVALIPTVGRITKRLRAELGERRSAIRATRELMRISTSSLEAYKTFERGRGLFLSGENRAAITVFRQALALDPDFATAWAMLGAAFNNLGEADSALAAFREALARPERLSEGWKLSVVPNVPLLSGDIAGALAASEREVQLMPHVYAHGNRSYYLSLAGRLSEALESCRAAERVSPFGANPGLLWNQFITLLQLGRVDEARPIALKFRGVLALDAPMEIAAAAGQWAAAESLATVLLSTPSADEFSRWSATDVLAAVQASRGQVSGADRTLHKAHSEAGARGDALRANRLRWTRLALMTYSHGVAAAPEEPGRWDSTTTGLVTRGLWAAAAGDTALARRLLATMRTHSAPQISRQGFTPALLQAWIAARAGRWLEVLSHIGPAAMQGEAVGFVQLQSAPLMRWMAAEAYEHLDRPDSAAAYFERAIAPPPVGGTDLAAPRMAFSFGHRRLVLLYARVGRLEDARRHWAIFSSTFTQPDPELKPLVEEARAALESAEAMARSARR